MLELVYLGVIEFSMFNKDVEGSVGELVPRGTASQSRDTRPDERNEFADLRRVTKWLGYRRYQRDVGSHKRVILR